jgi:hypothetical protein
MLSMCLKGGGDLERWRRENLENVEINVLNGGIWITPAASRLMTGKFPCCIWLSHAKCG